MASWKKIVTEDSANHIAQTSALADHLNATGAGDRSFTASPEVLFQDAASETGSLAKGTSDQWLRMNNAANALVWDTLDVVGGIKATGAIDFDGGSVTINQSSADIDVRIESNGDANYFVSDGGTDKVGIGVLAPASKLEVNQNSSTGAVACLELDQDDTDQPFIKFDGTTASDQSSSLTTDTSVGSITGHIRVDINGTDFWIPYYATNQEYECLQRN